MSSDAVTNAALQGMTYAMEARLAPHYERHLLDECGYQSHERVAQLALACAPERSQWLDVGAGSGLVGRALAQRGSAMKLTALDCSAAMLEQIDLPIYERLVIADCLQPLAENARYDGALAAGLLEHIAAPGLLFGNIREVLADDGWLIFTYPPQHEGAAGTFAADDGLIAHEPGELRRVVREAGFSIEHECEYPAYRNGSRGWVNHRVMACRVSRQPTAGDQA